MTLEPYYDDGIEITLPDGQTMTIIPEDVHYDFDEYGAPYFELSGRIEP